MGNRINYIVNIAERFDELYEYIDSAKDIAGIDVDDFIRLTVINATAVHTRKISTGSTLYSADMPTLFSLQDTIEAMYYHLSDTEVSKLFTIINVASSLIRRKTQAITLSSEDIANRSIKLDNIRRVIYVRSI